MTKVLRVVLGLFISGGLVLTFLSPFVFSAQPQDQTKGILDTPVPPDQQNGALDTPARRALAKERMDAWLHKRIPHPACPNCFKVEGESGIYETVPGTAHVISRDLPDPDPLEPDEIRSDRHPETGELLWYKGHQPFVGPTDEDNVSASLAVPMIAVKRIKYKHEDELFKIPGVHAVGIGEASIIVSLSPDMRANRSRIPSSVGGIPIIIEEAEVSRTASHQLIWYRPVPIGASIANSLGAASVGPHVSRDISDVGSCCGLYSLTAGHFFGPKHLPPTVTIYQPQGSTLPYGWFGFRFSQTACFGTQAFCESNGVINDTRWNPDAAAIGHPFNDGFPMPSPCPTSQKPVRRMVYGPGQNQYVDGPTGIIRIPTMSNCSSCLKNWGKEAHGTQGNLTATAITEVIQSAFDPQVWYRQGPMERSSADAYSGDSGGLVAWNQTKDVVGLVVATHINLSGLYTDYTRADYVKTAFFRAGVSFDHYWGTSAAVSFSSSYPAYRPSYPPPPGSQVSTDPLNPFPCSN
jgi:hypothetical protein